MSLTLPSAEDWIDTLAAVWDISDGRGGTVRSFRLFSKNEVPAAITVTSSPVAVSYPLSVNPKYSQGGPCILFWTGQTEFHLTNDVKTANLPYLMTWFGPILQAAAGNMTLGGKVNYFIIPEEDEAMRLVTYPNLEGKDDHQGISVRWMVKQDVSGYLNVAQ